jgi:pyruvate/2-oxoglutarate dehydrogenase complex dihydrolipoamide dehydrogenase (E3) component
MKAVKARKDAIVRAHRAAAVERSLKTLKGCTVYEGHASFMGRRKSRSRNETLKADKIFINVGGRAVMPRSRARQVSYLTNSSMMNVDFLPRASDRARGSYIGLEFAQLYRRFGSEVTVIELAPRLISREDEDVSRPLPIFSRREASTFASTARSVGVKKEAPTSRCR